MMPKNNTIIKTIATALIFVGFVGFFTVLAIGLMVVGIYVGFTWLFQYGIGATVIVIIAVLVIYATALSIGVAMLERKIEA